MVGPFVFFNVTKTKYLQILTTIMRYLNIQSKLLGQHIQTCFLTMNFLGPEIKMFRAIFVKFLVFAIIECKLVLQLLFISYRWAAFFCMVTIACVRLSAGKVYIKAFHLLPFCIKLYILASMKQKTQIELSLLSQVASPPVANFGGIPNMFGVCVYSFMCHHSLPSLGT